MGVTDASRVTSGENPWEMPSHVKEWYRQTPELDLAEKSIAAERDMRLAITHVDPSVAAKVKQTKFQAFVGGVRAGWDKLSLAIFPKLATIYVVLGGAVVFAGAGVIVVAVVPGVRLPGLEFIVKYIPVSIGLSLPLIRMGLHSVENGIRLSRRENKFVKDLEEKYHYFYIDQATGGIEEKFTKDGRGEYDRLIELKRLENRCSQWLHLNAHLDKGAPHGREIAYLASGRARNYQMRKEVIEKLQSYLAKDSSTPVPGALKAFVESLPQLTSYVGTAPPPSRSVIARALGAIDRLWTWIKNSSVGRAHNWLSNKWYSGCYKLLPALATVDMAVGWLSLVVGSIGFAYIFFPSLPTHGWIGLEMITQDKYLSISVGLLLFGNFINCVQRSWRMVGLYRRESKKAAIQDDLQMIDHLLEQEAAKEFHNWIQQQLDTMTKATPDDEGKRVLEEIKEAMRKIFEQRLRYSPQEDIPSLEVIKTRVDEIVKRWNENGKPPIGAISQFLKWFGDHVAPFLAKPATILGLVELLFGLACFVMCVAHHVPPALDFLTQNTPISILFSGSFVVAGLHMMHRGAALAKRKKKDGWKEDITKTRQVFLTALRPDLFLPKLRPDLAAQVADLTTYKGSEQYKAHLQEMIASIQPKLPKPKGGAPSGGTTSTKQTADTENLPQEAERNRSLGERIVAGYLKFSKLYDEAFKQALKGFWMVNLPLGGFLFVCALGGAIIAWGAPVPPQFEFVIKDPSFSLGFCLSTLAIGGDAINVSWRMGTYHKRYKDDKQERENIRLALQRYFARVTGQPILVDVRA